MSLKNQPLDTYAFQELVYDRIVHGNFQKVADKTKKHRSQHSREWNPAEPLSPPVLETCDELTAWKEVQPEIFEVQANLLMDVIVSLRATDEQGKAEDDEAEIKRLCDGMTTALLTRDEGEIRSAMVKLHALLDSRLRRRLSAAERVRESRFA